MNACSEQEVGSGKQEDSQDLRPAKVDEDVNGSCAPRTLLTP
jgi:hypothetical protein